tara:strand:- start:733 stop:975 length:243 start_codon:yes stop_codon:yes gene_type:complete
MIEEGKTMYADGLEKAMIGTTNDGKAVYIKEACVVIMMEEGLSYEDAIEFLEYNTFSAHVGDYTPIFIDGVDRDYFEPQT